MSCEIFPKMAIVRQTARQLKRPFLRDPKVPLKAKGQVIQSLVLSRGMHLAGCWPALLPREARALRRALVDTIRPMCGTTSLAHRLSDDVVLAQLGVLLPLRLVTLMRVQTAIRVATKAPFQLLALLFVGRLASRSWIKALEADLSHIALADCLS